MSIVSLLLMPLAAQILAPTTQTALVENQHWDEGMYMFHGSCGHLTTPKGDLSVGCAKVLSHWVYPGERTSYWFAQQGKALVTFSGLNEKRIGAAGGALIVDKVTTTSGPQWQARVAPARGLCLIAEVKKGRVRFKCDAKTDEGEFSGEFTSDGQAPEHPAPDGSN